MRTSPSHAFREPEEIDKPRSNCGIVGIYRAANASTLAYYALHALQHRGQEASGIVTGGERDGVRPSMLRVHKGAGLVTEVFSDQAILKEFLTGDVAIGHNRYSTTGSDNLVNIQPFLVNYRDGQLAVAHNGNLTNTRELRRRLQEAGTIFQTSTDTEVLLHLTARSTAATPEDRIMDALNTAKGAYSLVMVHEGTLIAARDPYGFRPLCIGRKGETWIVASETCAFDMIRAEYVRDVQPGEVLFFDERIQATGQPVRRVLEGAPDRHRHCIFEYIYFARPDSKIFGENVDKIRRMVDKLSGVWRFITDVMERGPIAIWEYIQEQLSNLWSIVLDAAKGWIMEKIVNAIVTKLLSMLDPTGIMAVINSVIAIYKAVQSFIQYLRQMLEIVNSLVNGVAEIASGNIKVAADFIDRYRRQLTR